VAITSGGDQCDQPLLALAIVLLVSAVINALFGIYTYHTVNNDVNNPLFGNRTMTPSQRMYKFVCEDVWMAVYICFIIGLIVLLFVTSAKAGSCSSDMGRMTMGLCIVLFVYLGIGLLICMGYVAVDAFKEWASECMCWMCPCLWPCLLIGCCLSKADDMEKDWKHKQVSTHSPPQADVERGPQTYVTNSAPMHQPAPVIVVQQAPPHSVVPQQVSYAQPAPQAIQPIQPPPQQYQQPYQQPYQEPVSQPYNPEAAAPMQPGILVVNQPPNQAESKMDNEPGTGNAEEKDLKQVAMETGKAAAVATGKGAKKAAVATGKGAKKAGTAALGWMAKKMNDLNDKVQEDKAAKSAEQQEGVGNNNTQ